MLASRLAERAEELSILVWGESGTGKELFARMVHIQAPPGPFVPVDCGAIPESLVESELFGWTRGAFTGANRSHLGLLRAASGGTLFLDEIGELPLGLQAKLLRVLQERVVRPIGATAGFPVRFRLISATNKDLRKEINEQRFRRDLYYRIAGVVVRMPPLREHAEDIPELVQHFLAQWGYHQRVSDEALAVMTTYEWPGNVRELQNILQRMCFLSKQETLTPRDFEAALELEPEFAASQTSLAGVVAADRILPLETLALEALQRALAAVGGDKTRAAQLLGISRTTLYRKLKLLRKQPQPAPAVPGAARGRGAAA